MGNLFAPSEYEAERLHQIRELRRLDLEAQNLAQARRTIEAFTSLIVSVSAARVAFEQNSIRKQ